MTKQQGFIVKNHYLRRIFVNKTSFTDDKEHNF